MLIQKAKRLPSFAPRRFFRSKFLKINLFILSYLLLFISIASLYILTISETQAIEQTLSESTVSEETNVAYLQISPTMMPEPTITPTQTPTPTITQTLIPATPIPTKNISVENTTKTIENVTTDHTMATANEIFNALNSYRNEKGIGSLSWDDSLANFAQGRVNTFASNGDLDGHAGFRSFMDNNGFEVSGFNGLGENSAQLSGSMGGGKIIREIFGQSSSHDSSQLDSSWTHVGIAVNGNFVNVNFGKNKR